MSNVIGITEGADPTVNLKWQKWVNAGKPAILITKRPDLLYPMLSGKENVIIHCTITGLGNNIESNIPFYKEELPYYHKLRFKFGNDRVVMRIDPIFPNPPLFRLREIRDTAHGRVRISFLDLYPHVLKRLNDNGIDISKQHDFNQPLEDRIHIWEALGEPEVCGEPDMHITPCVSEIDCNILGVKPSKAEKHQRFVCHCLANKKELCSPPPKCTYGCLYCYWK